MRSMFVKTYVTSLAMLACASTVRPRTTEKIFNGLPVQFQHGKAYRNGTEVIWDLLDPDAAPQIIEHGVEANISTVGHPHGIIEKRRTHCQGYNVNNLHCDSAVASFREFLRFTESGHYYLSTQDNTDWLAMRAGDVIVYACLADWYSLWPVTERDLNLGLYSMDVHCGRYHSGYLAGDGLGSYDRRIGKIRDRDFRCRP